MTDFAYLLYQKWFFFIILLYLAIAPIYLLRNTIPNKKQFVMRLAAITSIVIVLFYFVIPVPSSIQNKEIKFIGSIKKSNPDATFVHTSLALSKYCGNSRIKAYQYFLITDALVDDINLTIDKQGYFNGANEPSNINTDNLCNIQSF
ncbi:hypothetical protein HCY52_14845 [Acinetobacter radioresistens]|uniref:hypothetical protein n=1 Tax=Acinetobacter radioresistens TaxID=40216 RepID=UPI002003BE4C|nr:hypothetical protein [Acinetobacter radioresistens]MCK4085090.1 hypothetical protein [Acinetobacter radioresistens]